MGFVNLQEVKQMALDAKSSLENKASNCGRDVKIYWHWTAGHYNQAFGDYHFCIYKDGSIYATTDDLSETLNGTYRRNSGAVNIAFTGAYNATTNDLGPEPPTAEQIEACAKLTAVLTMALELEGNINYLMTHGEAADNEDGEDPNYESNGYEEGKYGPKNSVERWDLEFLGTSESPSYDPWSNGSRGGDVLRGKTNWYIAQYPNLGD